MKSACERFKEWFETQYKTHHCPSRDETIMELIARIEALEGEAALRKSRKGKGKKPTFTQLKKWRCSVCGRVGSALGVPSKSDTLVCESCDLMPGAPPKRKVLK